MTDRFYPIPSMGKPALNFQGAYPKDGHCSAGCGTRMILTTPTKKCDACRAAGKAASEKKSKAKKRKAA